MNDNMYVYNNVFILLQLFHLQIFFVYNDVVVTNMNYSVSIGC